MPPKTVSSTCSVCKKAYGDHSEKKCEACGRPMEHHTDDEEHIEWVSLARMGRAKLDANEPLTKAEAKALRMHPEPPSLTLGGYV